MFRTFNMGVGMVAVVSPETADAALAAGVGAFRLGEIVEGSGVELV
jgi:phosphoribosylformylglycinamidine cyclo-ligase